MTEDSPKPAADIEFVQIRESVLVEVRRFEHHQHLIAPRRARFRGVVRRSFRRRHPSGGCLRPASGLPACADGWGHWVPSGVIRGLGGGGTSPRGLEGLTGRVEDVSRQIPWFRPGTTLRGLEDHGVATGE
jgi:hypothetical protein